MLTQPQREELRFAIREQLAAAQTVALTAEMIFRRVGRTRMVDFEFSQRDVEEALTFLVGLAQATETPAPLGATKYYQATSAGVLAHERGS
jgi:hypothetical protein